MNGQCGTAERLAASEAEKMRLEERVHVLEAENQRLAAAAAAAAAERPSTADLSVVQERLRQVEGGLEQEHDARRAAEAQTRDATAEVERVRMEQQEP